MKIYLETYGCTLNQADSIMIRNILSEYSFTSNPNEADFIIINTCAVKSSTENKILKRIKDFSHLNEKLIIAGCLSVEEKEIRKTAPKANIIYPGAIERIKEAIDNATNHRYGTIKGVFSKPLELIKPEGVILKIPIQEGCLNQCTYCITKFARFKLISYPKIVIKRLIERETKNGVLEIELTGTDTGTYGLEKGEDLIELLEEVLKIKNKFFVRLGMINPQHVYRMLDELIEIYKNEKMYKFLHIPVQSGSDKVLKEMKRGYNIETFKKIIKKFRKEIPNITIATDIIVGYPTETKEDFEKTVELIKEIKFDVVNLSKFTSRPFTFAKTLKQLPSQTIKERSQKIHKILEKIEKENNKKYIEKVMDVFITEKNKGRSINYKQIVVDKGKIGEIIKVKIKEATKTSLIGVKI